MTAEELRHERERTAGHISPRRLEWTPDENAQALAVSEAIAAAREAGRKAEYRRVVGLRNHLLRSIGRGSRTAQASRDVAAMEAFDGMLIRGEHAPGAKP